MKKNTLQLAYNIRQIRRFEALAMNIGITGDELMKRAGQAALAFILKKWPETKSMIIFCGHGNNGGDGYALAQCAYEHGLSVKIRYLDATDGLKNEAHNALLLCEKLSINKQPFDEKEIFSADLFVDALFGIGLTEPIQGAALPIIQYLNHSHIPILSIDIPSGIHADTGALLNVAVKATATITFMGLKQGLLTNDALDYTGEIYCHDLQLPPSLFTAVESTTQTISIDIFKPYRSPRLKNAHKGDFGHVLIIGGNIGFSGAPQLTALGALRAGAGCVTIATHPSHASNLTVAHPEMMVTGIESAEDLLPLLKRATTVVIGPGLGQTTWSKKLFNAAIKTPLPLLIDADGLRLLAEKPFSHENWILTPHPGEAAQLLKITASKVQQDRFSAAKKIQRRYNAICLLKGAGTLIIDETQHINICTDGNPGMASGGMGDLLSGIIAALVAQHIPLSIATQYGVCIHAKAGDLAAKEGERGMMATDLLPWIRHWVNQRSTED